MIVTEGKKIHPSMLLGRGERKDSHTIEGYTIQREGLRNPTTCGKEIRRTRLIRSHNKKYTYTLKQSKATGVVQSIEDELVLLGQKVDKIGEDKLGKFINDVHEATPYTNTKIRKIILALTIGRDCKAIYPEDIIKKIDKLEHIDPAEYTHRLNEFQKLYGMADIYREKEVIAGK